MNRGAGDASLRAARWSCEIPSRIDRVDGICREMRQRLEAHRLSGLCFDMELLAREFLNNAILHGNSGQARKKVRLEMSFGRRWIRLQITDQGKGFSWRRRLRTLPGEEEDGGRGIAIGLLYSDRIRFSRRGNQVTLWRKRQTGKE